MQSKYVKWSGTEDNKTVTLTGMLVQTTDTHHTIQSDCGTFKIPTNDGSITTISKNKCVSSIPAKVTSTPPSSPKAGSKREKAMIIVRDVFGKGHGSKATIQRLQDVLDMPKTTATTYFYHAKKQLQL